MADLHDLAPFYVLDALGEEERAAFERHLESCDACRREIADLIPGVEALARSVAESPPPGMKADVMAAIDAAAGAEERGPAAVVPMRRRTSRVIAAAVAVAAVVAIVLGVGLGSSDPRDATIESILALPDRSVVEIQTDVASSAEVVYSADAGEGVFVASGLASVPGGQTYQLWLIGDDGPVSAGVFRPDDDGSVQVLLDGDVRPGLTLGLTVEPEGGSDAPTGEILLAREL